MCSTAPDETSPLPSSPPAAVPEPTKTTFDAVIVPFSNLNGAILRYAVIVLEDTGTQNRSQVNRESN